MVNHISESTTLANGVKMPWFGFGVYQVEDGEEVERSVKAALETGYRGIDTAAFYENEEGVGKAIKDSGVSRDDLFITTKVWNDRQGYEETLKSFEESRRKLGLDVVDLFLVHWPVSGKYKDTWRALEKLYNDGAVRAIGVSNFKEHHLEDLMATSEVNPMVNQVEFHPRLAQKDLLKYCQQHDIQLEAWGPLMRGKILGHETLQELADKYGKTTAQVVLRWELQLGIVTIPKSVHEKRIKENADVFDFELAPEDMAKMDELNQNERTGPDPDDF
ncbi:MAG TPA: aldo/keto reductase [Bacillales bacterium]|nr:aldo/keto reductase [Bacillales bacterium]